MSEIKALDKLRKLANNVRNGSCDTSPAIVAQLIAGNADNIKREIEERYMELPLDADGVPIHMGDVMELSGGRIGKVVAVSESQFTAHVEAREKKPVCQASLHHHVNPRTLEDVLYDFGERVCNSGHQWGLDAADVVPQFADEIRELLGSDVE